MRILNLGAGVQSTCIFLMSHEGLIEPIDHAIFADTQEEPEAVYQHLAWLRTIPAPVPIIHIATAGKLGDDLIAQETPTNKGTGHLKEHHRHRFATIPAFTAKHHETRQLRDACAEGMVRRQCTKEYKVEVVERVIRREILGLQPGQRIPKEMSKAPNQIRQLFGFSYDEGGRAARVRSRFQKIPWARPVFPLIDKSMRRFDCVEYLKTRVPHETPRSACVFCPFKRASEWLKTKQNPNDWARALEIDRAIRTEGTVANRSMSEALYLHRKCIPLDMIDFEEEARKEAAKKATPLFALLDCGEGMCGV